ncbi:MAG: isoprenylcysteine carboxylmethyltransferase family protein [Sphingomonas sp.]|nr:isoprenylcysteine carboxylmethyltransferase family protein [Sphingomonas sp.]
MFAVPVSLTQFIAFCVTALGFFASIALAFWRKSSETGATTSSSSRVGILLQMVGFAIVGFGVIRVALDPLSPFALLETATVIALMGGAIALFVTSSRALGRNWSLVARTRTDHELIRSGPYARVRHPIYLAMLLFLIALAIGLGHWGQLLIAVPLFLIGTRIRTNAEDHLLEQSFGDAFRQYRDTTPALLPKIG